MYTWGELKDASLAKLNLTENEAEVQGLLSAFEYYANEVITQICSSIKPKYTFAEFSVTCDGDLKPGTIIEMPEDFVSFGDDVNYELRRNHCNNNLVKEGLYDEDFSYIGTNQIIFYRTGHFFISYNARWYKFPSSLAGNTVLNVPDDILECIPSYIASQCWKIDDEYKSSVFRNEYEMALARIDNTNYKNTKTFKIGGGW